MKYRVITDWNSKKLKEDILEQRIPVLLKNLQETNALYQNVEKEIKGILHEADNGLQEQIQTVKDQIKLVQKKGFLKDLNAYHLSGMKIEMDFEHEVDREYKTKARSIIKKELIPISKIRKIIGDTLIVAGSFLAISSAGIFVVAAFSDSISATGLTAPLGLLGVVVAFIGVNIKGVYDADEVFDMLHIKNGKIE